MKATNEETILVQQNQENEEIVNNSENTQFDSSSESKDLKDSSKSKVWKKAGIGVGSGVAAGIIGALFTSGVIPTADSSQETVDNGQETAEDNGESGMVADSLTTPIVTDGHLPIAHNVNDDMSFDEAFRSAHDEVGAGGVFEWHGQLYGTYTESEWNSLSDAEKMEYNSHLRVVGKPDYASNVSNHDTDEQPVEAPTDDLAVNDTEASEGSDEVSVDTEDVAVNDTEASESSDEVSVETEDVAVNDTEVPESSDEVSVETEDVAVNDTEVPEGGEEVAVDTAEDVAVNDTEVPGGAEQAPVTAENVAELINPEGSAGQADDMEVEVLGVNYAQTDEGQEYAIGGMSVNGQDVYVLDADNDGTGDVAWVDANGDGQVEDAEIRDISEQPVDMSTFENTDTSYSDGEADEPDYIAS